MPLLVQGSSTPAGAALVRESLNRLQTITEFRR